MEVMFSGDSRLRVIDAFKRCTSLVRMEVPASVETIELGFLGGSLRRELILEPGTRIRAMAREAHALITFVDDNDMKKHRRRVNLRAIGGFKGR
jgi:hypothetical protein